MLRLLARRMHGNDAPRSQFERLAIPYDSEPGPADLLVAEQAGRAAAVAEPLTGLLDVAGLELLRTPLTELVSRPGMLPVIQRHIPALAAIELVAIPPGTSLIDIAGYGSVTAGQLRGFLDEIGSAATT